jgi:AcrR family transcriptional regulator
MDLRVKRTTKSIKDAFFELRKKKSIEKISVKELSELAMINKATFYLHYKDIYDLSEKLEERLINRIISDLRIKGYLRTRKDIYTLNDTLSRAIFSQWEEISVLYSGFETNRFIDHLEDRLKEYIFSTYSQFKNNPEDNIILTFLIQGSYHAHIRNNSYGDELLTKTTSALFAKLVD